MNKFCQSLGPSCYRFPLFMVKNKAAKSWLGGGGRLAYMGYIGICCPKGYGFQTIPVICTEAHIPTLRYGNTLRMRTTISPGHWQPWTAVLPLLGLISMA